MPKLLKSLFSAVVGISFVLLPGATFAAYNDASLSSDVVITIGTTAVNINGSADVLETLAVGASSAVLTLEENSTVTVLVPSKLVLSASGGQVTNSTCSASGFTATYTTTSGTQTDVTLTVTDEICTITSQSSGGGGGGGGGGSSSSDTTTDTITTTTTTDTPAVTTPPAQALSIADLMAQISALQAKIAELKGTSTVGANISTFARNLYTGISGADVTALQSWLISHGYSIPAGATGFFGAQTRAAISAFQLASGISPAVGFFGPITRAKVNSM